MWGTSTRSQPTIQCTELPVQDGADKLRMFDNGSQLTSTSMYSCLGQQGMYNRVGPVTVRLGSMGGTVNPRLSSSSMSAGSNSGSNAVGFRFMPGSICCCRATARLSCISLKQSREGAALWKSTTSGRQAGSDYGMSTRLSNNVAHMAATVIFHIERVCKFLPCKRHVCRGCWIQVLPPASITLGRQHVPTNEH